MLSLWQLIKLLFKVLFLGRKHRKSMEQLRSSMGKQNAIGAMLEAYRVGDYETALQATAPLKEIDEACYSFFHGSMLNQIGRTQEAEKELRKCAALRQEEQLAAFAYSTHGQVLVELQRYEEGLKCFETSLGHDPSRGGADRDIAHMWLIRGKPDQALPWAKSALEKERASTMAAGSAAEKESCELNTREALATLAWAVASTDRDREEVDRLAAEAIPPPETRAPSSCAEVHVHLGKAYAALEDAAKSEWHFDEAARIDPKGLWGRAARSLVASR
jgi:tetratricopeptide (TPR) repeat protein